ncbi:MAG: carbohydrate ABC transporter permease [Chloroflexota bacterium]|nr:carbohydrate ABC transporter permease [Chloroflexota bacterium]
MTAKFDTAHHAGQRWSVGRLVRVGTLGLMALVFAVPIVTFMLMSMREEDKFGNIPGGIYSLEGLSLDNVARNLDIILTFNNGLFTTWLTNSLIMSVSATILAVLTAVPAGYAIAKLRFPGRSVLRFVTLLTMVMPNTVLVIPIFLEVSAVGKVFPMFSIGQLWPVIVIMAFYPFGVYLSYIHFMTTLPRELIEAARIDGLGDVSIFVRIAAPLAKQAVALVVFFSFVANWTNYFLPLVLLPLAKQQPVSIGLQHLIAASPIFDPTKSAGLAVSLWMPQLALATTITIIPLFVLFIAAQRFLMRGAVVGAVKG